MVMSALGNSSTRFDFRLQAAQKRAIERAASLMGMSLTQFAKATLIAKAEEVVQKYSATVLSDRDRDRFLELLDADAAPSAAMMRAAKRYKKLRDAHN